MRRTVCIDFDGVIHDYDGRWKGHSVIEGGVVIDTRTGKTAIKMLEEYVEEFDVVILTTRGATVLGQEAVLRWLERNGASIQLLAEISVTDEKPPALIYIDDRGWRFGGVYPTVDEIFRALPWNKGGEKA